MPRRWYVGPYVGMHTLTQEGEQLTVQQGEAVEVSAVTAAKFDEQPELWSKRPPDTQPETGDDDK